MSSILIIKLGAAGDVVRTTPITTLFTNDEVDWITAPVNAPLLTGTATHVSTHPAQLPAKTYDLVISLEEDQKTLASIFSHLCFKQVIGAYPTAGGHPHYTSELREWFDMSLISDHRSTVANDLKLTNRRSYQEILFAGLGARFGDEEYILPTPAATALGGDIALIDSTGGRWPNKRWGHLTTLAARLSPFGRVTILPWRSTILEHLADIANHRIVVTPDSLPLHFAIGLKKLTFGLFTCTSPWEIHPYRRLTRLISPRLAEFYYTTSFDLEATLALSPDDVFNVVRSAL